jgi:hypothetical protein
MIPDRFRRQLPALGFAALVCACASVEIGSAFDLRAFETGVQRGVTTRAQVQAWLGAPVSKGVAVEASGQRFEEWIYYHGEGRMPRLSGAKLKTLQIRFDADGIVRAYNWSGGP